MPGSVSIEEGATINLRKVESNPLRTIVFADHIIHLKHEVPSYGSGGSGHSGGYSWGGNGGSISNGTSGSNLIGQYTSSTLLTTPQNGAGGQYPGGDGESRSGNYLGTYDPGRYYRVHSNGGGGAAGQHGKNSENLTFIVANNVVIEGSIIGQGEDGGNGGNGGSSTGACWYNWDVASYGGGGGAGGAGGHGSKIYIITEGVVDITDADLKLTGGNGGRGGLGGYGDKHNSVQAPATRAGSGTPGGDGNDGFIEIHSISKYDYHLSWNGELNCVESVSLDGNLGNQFTYNWVIDNDTISGTTPFINANTTGIYKLIAQNGDCELESESVYIEINENNNPDLLSNEYHVDVNNHHIVLISDFESNYLWNDTLVSPSFLISSDRHTHSMDTLTVQALINKCLEQDSAIIYLDSLSQQQIPLNPGWNMISFYVDQSEESFESIFENIIPNSNFIYQNDHLIYSTDFGFETNNLQAEWDKTYWIECNQADTLTIEGKILEKPFNYDLITGENFISFPLYQSRSVEGIINQLGNSLDEINDGIRTTSPALPDELNSLKWLVPGKGYRIIVNQNTSLNIE
jgi:hypothetical protein